MLKPTTLAFLLAAAPVAAQETRSLAPGAPSPPATIDQLAWLEGAWTGDGLGAPATEVYSAPQAGQIAGHFVQTDPKGGVMFYELLQIAPRGRSLVYRLRHFNADLTGWEDAKPKKAVEFPLVAIDGDAAYFDGLTLKRTGPDAMTATVRIGGEGGPKEVSFRYRRVRR
ncbi:DUF6265 family protein [Sphingomonas lenta]|uniref:DUF6265 domain-containing protein n=1 Tax=Sphingomonas lenta TaxID=1141887 RepID=A0A2A2SE93_9SPHN|nr:DUF6265 family protein [Sphingomonas lenta]PAX07577.1 hypothetical protein CKY28_07935 [Sphingomonas lenta]